MNSNPLESSSGPTTYAAVHAYQLDSIAWFAPVDKIVIQYHIRASWQLSGRSSLGHFLYADSLVVSENAVPKFRFQYASLIVCLWRD